MKQSQQLASEARHYAAILRQAVKAAGFTMTEVEHRLGAGPKSLRRVLCGAVDLKVKHVLAVLRVIGMSQQEFFSIATRTPPDRRRGRSAGGRLLETFERIGYRGEFVSSDEDLDGPASNEEFNRLVAEVVEQVMERRAKQKQPPPPEELPPPEPLDQEAAGGGEEDPGEGGEPE
jgi:transcriptional regulator with XRE-family HTH domain